MRGSHPFQKLVLMFGTLYPEYAGGEIYDSVSRDYRESKEFMQDKEWSSEEMETRLREVMPQYFQDSYWREQRFPAFGLFMQFNKFKPNQIKAQVKRTNSTWTCPTCGLQDKISSHKCTKATELIADLGKRMT